MGIFDGEHKILGPCAGPLDQLVDRDETRLEPPLLTINAKWSHYALHRPSTFIYIETHSLSSLPIAGIASHDTTIGHRPLMGMNQIRYRSRIEFDTPIRDSPSCSYLYGSVGRLQYGGNTYVVTSAVCARWFRHRACFRTRQTRTRGNLAGRRFVRDSGAVHP